MKNKLKTLESKDHSKNGVSPKRLINRSNFFRKKWIVVLATILIFSGCEKDKKVWEGDPTLRYETVPFARNSVSNAPNAKSGGTLDNLVFSDYDDEYNYYFFVLGHINSVPLAYRPAVYYNGTTPITVVYSSGNVTQTSISNSITEAHEHSVTTSRSTNWGNEIGVKAEFKAKVPLLVENKFEASYKHTWGGSEGTDITDSRSFSSTFETSNTKASEIRDEVSVTIGNNNEPAGLYRFSLFSTTDVYFVVVTDRAKTEIIEASTVFCARPVQRWELDYDPDRNGSFGKTASGVLLEIPEITVSQLPDIAECIHEWSIWSVTTAPTATTEGEETRTCSLCFRTETQAVPIIATGTFDLVTGAWVNGSGNATFNNNVLTVNDGARIIITSNGTNTNRRIVVNGIAIITLRDVSITGLGDYQSPIVLNNTTNAIFRLEGTNILVAGRSSAGIQTTDATLTINGKGSLTATGGNGRNGSGGANEAGDGAGAGIGGSGGGAGGIVTINSGTITAQGGNAGNGGNGHAGWGTGKGGGGAGAGIGGGGGRGGEDNSNRNGRQGGAGGIITINFGTSVEANGGLGGNRGSQTGIFPGQPGNGGGQGAAYGGGGGGGAAGDGSNGSQGAAGTLTDLR